MWVGYFPPLDLTVSIPVLLESRDWITSRYPGGDSGRDFLDPKPMSGMR